jgi:hypothetical protein
MGVVAACCIDIAHRIEDRRDHIGAGPGDGQRESVAASGNFAPLTLQCAERTVAGCGGEDELSGERREARKTWSS